MNKLLRKARLFAEEAHEGQVRKYTGEPYINHPANVVKLLSLAQGVTDEMLAAAWLHDVVEDTSVNIRDIYSNFGSVVGELVVQLTDVSELNQGNRATRKAIDRVHTGMSSPEAKTIKLADLIDNTESIVEHDPKFAKVYLAEKRELLKVLHEGDVTLYQMAKNQL